MIDVSPGKIAGVKLIRPSAQRDLRGTFVKTMHADIFSKHGIPIQYAEQYYSVSKSNVLRGLHFQTPPHDHYKLVTCIEGEAFDVVVDLRKASPTYRQHETFELNGSGGDSVFVPTGCAHGFYVRSESAILLYNVSTLHAPSHDAGIRWDSAGVSWPSDNPVVSERDAALVTLAKFESPF